ncbi:UNVERIFIED_ORG: DNA-binding MarR family transcriptional regulator [Martelella mediterranea]
MRIPDLICRVNHALEHSAETQLKQHSLTIEQFRVLTVLSETNGISMGALSASICVDSPTLTKLIDRMINTADVYRGPDPRDRRKVLVFISNKGLKTYEALADIHRQQQDMLSEALGEQRLEVLETLLNDTLRAIKVESGQYRSTLENGELNDAKPTRLS